MPDPSGGFSSYEITESMSTGSITQAPGSEFDPVYDISLFSRYELTVTNGSQTGLVLETKSPIDFIAIDISALQENETLFGFNPSEWLVQFDPTFLSAVGSTFATGSNHRLNVQPVPEPSSTVIVLTGCIMLLKRRRI